LFELNKNAQISPEAAGVGFALAIAQAKKYHGLETSSIQVLREANIPLSEQEAVAEQKPTVQASATQTVAKSQVGRSRAELYQSVLKTFMDQSEGWKKRNLFERQWVSRDFKKTIGFSIDEMQAELKALGDGLKAGASTAESIDTVNKIVAYYVHQQEQLRGFEKNHQKLAENLKIMDGWIDDAKALTQALSN
jgi:hypothetical protein